MDDNSSWQTSVFDALEINFNQDYHIAVVLSNNQVKWYLNNELIEVDDNIIFSNLELTSTELVHIGYANTLYPSTMYKGLIDELSLWNIQLTESQLQNNVYQNNDIAEGMIAYWKFDQGSGNIVNDYSGNQWHGNIIGVSNWVQSELVDPCCSDVENDADGDGICESDEVAGCTDESACNYNDLATDEDNSCTYTDGICDSCIDGVVVDNDSDDDTVCDDDDACYGFDDTIDSDEDGLADGCDICPFDAENDADGDGLCCSSLINTDYYNEYYSNSNPEYDLCCYDTYNDADGDGVCGDVDQCEGFDDNVDTCLLYRSDGAEE